MNVGCFLSLAEEIRQLDAKGLTVDSNPDLKREFDSLEESERVAIGLMVLGARSTRESVKPLRTAAQTDTPAMVADWQRRAADEERAGKIRHAIMVVGAFVLGILLALAIAWFAVAVISGAAQIRSEVIR